MRFAKKSYVFNQTLRGTRESNFSEINKNCSNNLCVLFATVNRLTNPPLSLPLELISTSKCNEFAIFFHDKVQGIKNAIISTTKITTLQPARHLELTHFTPVTDKTIEETICSLSSSTCCLDELPTRFLKSVLSSLLPQLAHLVNISLQTGTFPKALKTAVIKPLLKRSNLDATVLNN